MSLEAAAAEPAPAPGDLLRAWGPEATEAELEAYLQDRPMLQRDPLLLEAARAAWRGEPQPDGRYLYPSRRGLEASLALYHGQDAAQWAQQQAHRPWGELVQEALDLAPQVRLIELAPEVLARKAEGALLRKQRQGEELFDLAPPPQQRQELPVPDTLREAWDKLGSGTRSGRSEDYTRAELRRLLGFRERDCAEFSDQQLLAMALDGHLLPRWQGSPSHAQLALQATEIYSRGWGDTALKEFRRALRTPYGKLARFHGNADSGQRSLYDMTQALARRNPVLAASGVLGRENLLSREPYAEYIGGAQRPDSQRHASPAGELQQRTRLELQFQEAFQRFSGELPGTTRLRRIEGSLGRHRGALGVYEPQAEVIRIHSRLAGLADRAQRGQAQPGQIHDAVSTLAHELLHAQEGRDTGNQRAGRAGRRNPEHSLDEGGTEALARLYTDRLASHMGLWDSGQKGSLRQHAVGRAYPGEVETVVALAAAASGELDSERLRSGGYAEPEVLSEPARRWLLHLHTEHGVDGRMRRLEELYCQRTGAEEAEGRRWVTQVLRECKSSRYQWRARRVRNAQGDYEQQFAQPESLGGTLAKLLAPLAGGRP